MFCEGRHTKKNKRRSKNMRCFFDRCFFDFPSKIDVNHAKSTKNGLVNRNRRKSTFGKSFFSNKSIFARFLWSLWVPRGLPGRPGKFPKSLISLINGQLPLNTTVDGLRDASGRPRRCLQAPPGFASIFGSILHVKNKRKSAKKVENTRKKLKNS